MSTAPESVQIDRTLLLFTVTLPWNPNDPGEGDFQGSFWAVDSAEAVHLLAREMAEKTKFEDGEEEAFIANLVEQAPEYAAVPTLEHAVQSISRLVAGPQSFLTEAAKADLATIKEVLTRYLYQPAHLSAETQEDQMDGDEHVSETPSF